MTVATASMHPIAPSGFVADIVICCMTLAICRPGAAHFNIQIPPTCTLLNSYLKAYVPPWGLEDGWSQHPPPARLSVRIPPVAACSNAVTQVHRDPVGCRPSKKTPSCRCMHLRTGCPASYALGLAPPLAIRRLP